MIVGTTSLESILPKFKKIKLTKFKILTTFKNYINIETTRLLISKSKVIFIQLRQTFIKINLLIFYFRILFLD